MSWLEEILYVEPTAVGVLGGVLGLEAPLRGLPFLADLRRRL